MSALGIEIDVVAPNDEKSKAHEKIGSIDVHRFNYFFKRFQKIAYGYGGIVVNLKRNKFLYLLAPLFILSFLFKVIKVARKCDVIHANWIINGYVSVLAGILTRKPVILTLRGEDVNQYKKKSFLYRSLSSIFFKRIDSFTAVSSEFCRFLKSIGIPEEKVFLVPNGVEKKNISSEELSRFKSEYKLDDENTNILFVGSLIERKGVEYLLKAFSSIKQDNVKLYIVGEGALKGGLISLAEKLKIHDNVVFAGYQHYDKIPYWLSSADIFVLPSLSEGRPNVILESLAYGVPTVATNIGGTNELINDGINGLLCEPKDADSLSERLNELINDAELQEKLSIGAKKFIIDEGLTWESCASNYIRLYERAVKR
jgi:glycosyltransferase involved in cell wall biosynthesis